MDETTARHVWQILVEEAGASERDRDVFVRYLTQEDTHGGHEYRFMGTLGFGGKLHYNHYRGARISCYPEDSDASREAVIARVNERLQVVAPGAS